MASVVQIQVKVDNGQALPQLDQLNNALNSVGVKGTASFNQAGKAADEAKGHFQTNLDSVRLLSQEFGFRLPRAIESMLSRVPAVTGALNSMLGVMAGIAAAEVFVHVAQELHRVYEEYLSIDAAQQKYIENQDKARNADIGNTRSVETAKARLLVETQIGAQLHQQARDLTNYKLGPSSYIHNLLGGGLVDRYDAHNIEARAVQADVARDALSRKVGVDDLNQTAILNNQQKHAMDSELLGRGKINAELQKKLEMDAQEQKYVIAQEKAFGNRVAPNAGQAERDAKDAIARGEAAAQTIDLDRKERDERIAAQNEAINAGLEGEAKYMAERDQAIDKIRQKEIDGETSLRTMKSVTASLEQKYDNERQQRLDKQIQQAQQIMREAQQASLTGAARIGAEHGNALERINTDRTLDPKAASIERQAAAIEATQKLTALEDQFAEHVKSLNDERVASALQGYAKIDAEAQKQIADLQRAYDQDFKDAQLTIAQKLQAEKNFQDGKSAIDAAAAQQRQQLAVRNAQEDQQYAQQAMQAEAHVREDGFNGWIAGYQNAIQEIESKDAQQTSKLKEELAARQIDETNFANRKGAIDAEANANIEEQNQQMQQKIAGDLQQAFTNPVDFIKSQMEKMFFEIVAGWIMRMNVFKTLFGQTMGSLQPGVAGASPSSGIGGILGSAGSLLHGVSGIPGTRGIVNGSPTTVGVSSGGAHTGTGVGGAISDISSAANTIGGLHLGGSTASSDASWDPLLKNAQDVGDGTAGATGAASSISRGASTLGSVAAVGMGGYQAFKSTTEAFEKGDPLQGALGDAAAGATLGMAAGPIGAAVGAAIGAGVGASAGLIGMVSGEAGKLGARDYYEQNVFPQLEQMLTGSGSTDFQSAASSVGSTSAQAMAYMQMHFGKDAAAWVNANYMQKEVARVLSQIENTAAGGRQYTMKSAVQFHTGGTITGFGSLGTSSNEGFIHAMLGETVMNPGASSAHGAALRAMNSGASASEMASMYLSQSKPGGVQASSPGGDTHHWTVNALDAKSFSTFLKNGGAQQIVKHVNTYASQYAGDGISG